MIPGRDVSPFVVYDDEIPIVFRKRAECDENVKVAITAPGG